MKSLSPMSSSQRVFTDLEEGRSFLNQLRSKPGQRLKITIQESDESANNEFKNALKNVFGMWRNRDDLDSVFGDFRADFDRRFDTHPS